MVHEPTRRVGEQFIEQTQPMSEIHASKPTFHLCSIISFTYYILPVLLKINRIKYIRYM